MNFRLILSVHVVTYVLTGELIEGSGKHKGGSRDFREKPCFKFYKDLIAANR